MGKRCFRATVPLFVVVCLTGALLLAGCKKTTPPISAVGSNGVPGGPPAGSPDPALSGPFAAGRKVFDAHGCARCHKVGGVGGQMAGGPGPGGMMNAKGPDLGKVGADAAHTPQWLADHVRNPKGHKPQSRMPPYAGKMSEEDLTALADYLANLK